MPMDFVEDFEFILIYFDNLFSILIIILIIGGDFENLSLKIGICLMFGVSSD